MKYNLTFVIAFTASLVLIATAPVYAGLIGSYAFEEGSGTVIQDTSGRSNNGNLINGNLSSWTTGHSGGGLYFAGVEGAGSTYVNLGNPADFQLSNAFTFTAWVYSANPGSDEPILAKEGSSNLSYWFGVFQRHFGVLADNTGTYNWDLDKRGDGTVPANQWHYLASTWDGNTVYNYFDGGLVSSGTSYSNTLFNGTANLTIGVNSNWNNTAFKGTLDDIHIYNSYLTADQIRADMDMSPVPEPTTMLLLGLGLMGLAGVRRKIQK